MSYDFELGLRRKGGSASSRAVGRWLERLDWSALDHSDRGDRSEALDRPNAKGNLRRW